MPLNAVQLARKENTVLASYAVKSAKSAGRKFPEKAEPNRLCFQKDKERIIHCKAFRRLDKKTQVFIAGSGDHYRTRLTHTLEVAQISRDIARRLGLNEDLSEAIALAHDLGHPPFGHAGEEALDEVMRKFGDRFEHNDQSRRVVEKLEKSYPDFDGLNLSLEVLDGLIKHQTPWDQKNMEFEISANLEAQIVNIADEIAYTNHDIDDGIRSGLIPIEYLRQFKVWQLANQQVTKQYGGNLRGEVLVSRTVSKIISMMIDDLCAQAEKNIKKYRIRSVEDVRRRKDVIADFSPGMKKMIANLRRFLFDHFYMNKTVMRSVENGKRMIKKVFAFYFANPKKLPTSKHVSKEPFHIVIKDYVAGMTDSFLIEEYKKHIIKKKK